MLRPAAKASGDSPRKRNVDGAAPLRVDTHLAERRRREEIAHVGEFRGSAVGQKY
jgi:hypothetical protein